VLLLCTGLSHTAFLHEYFPILVSNSIYTCKPKAEVLTHAVPWSCLPVRHVPDVQPSCRSPTPLFPTAPVLWGCGTELPCTPVSGGVSGWVGRGGAELWNVPGLSTGPMPATWLCHIPPGEKRVKGWREEGAQGGWAPPWGSTHRQAAPATRQPVDRPINLLSLAACQRWTSNLLWECRQAQVILVRMGLAPEKIAACPGKIRQEWHNYIFCFGCATRNIANCTFVLLFNLLWWSDDVCCSCLMGTFPWCFCRKLLVSLRLCNAGYLSLCMCCWL